MFKKFISTTLFFTFPCIALSAPIPDILINSTDIELSSNVYVNTLSGPALTSTDALHLTSLFTNGGTHATVNANIDDPVSLSADASISNMGGNYFTMMTNAEFDWGAALTGPLPEADYEGTSVEAISSLSSTFKVTSSAAVEFSGTITNYEGNTNGSKGKIDLFDMTSGSNILSLDDSAVFDSIVRGSVLLLPGHTYKLDALSINRTGGDEEIYTDFLFKDALVSVPSPRSIELLGIGIFLLLLIQLAGPLLNSIFRPSFNNTEAKHRPEGLLMFSAS